MDLWELQDNWDDCGRIDPLFAVLSYDGKENQGWDEKEFFSTGEQEIRGIMSYLQSLDLKPHFQQALDFGSGVGRLTQALAQYFETVQGIDIAPSMVRLAEKFNRHKNRVHYHLNSTDNLRLFQDQSFDFIYSNITLQHMEPKYIRKYILEFARLLRPQGVLIFQLPEAPPLEGEAEDTAGMKRLLKRSLPKFLIRFYRRLRYKKPKLVMWMYGLPKQEVCQLLSAEGLKIVEVVKFPMSKNEWISYRYCVQKA